MVEIRITPAFNGPTILELAAVLSEIQGTVDVRWQGTRAEYSALGHHPKRQFILHVQDTGAMERAATVLGNPFTFDTALLATALSSLNSRKAYNWRSFVSDNYLGSVISRGLITRIAAGAIRKGVIPLLADIATECLLDNVNAIDADVLLRLRVMRGSYERMAQPGW